MKNEKGFIFPLTLMVTFIAFFVIISSVNIYLSEARYLNETKGYYIRNGMMTIAVKRIMNQIENENILDHGTISFEDGLVSYTIQQMEADQYQILMITNSSFGQETKNEVIYNHKQKRITKWVEN
jgi:hypothetical protein